jgi:hypothetical protein
MAPSFEAMFKQEMIYVLGCNEIGLLGKMHRILTPKALYVVVVRDLPGTTIYTIILLYYYTTIYTIILLYYIIPIYTLSLHYIILIHYLYTLSDRMWAAYNFWCDKGNTETYYYIYTNTYCYIYTDAYILIHTITYILIHTNTY